MRELQARSGTSYIPGVNVTRVLQPYVSSQKQQVHAKCIPGALLALYDCLRVRTGTELKPVGG